MTNSCESERKKQFCLETIVGAQKNDFLAFVKHPGGSENGKEAMRRGKKAVTEKVFENPGKKKMGPKRRRQERVNKKKSRRYSWGGSKKRNKNRRVERKNEGRCDLLSVRQQKVGVNGVIENQEKESEENLFGNRGARCKKGGSWKRETKANSVGKTEKEGKKPQHPTTQRHPQGGTLRGGKKEKNG